MNAPPDNDKPTITNAELKRALCCSVVSLASYILLTNHYVTVCRLNFWWGILFNIEKSTYCTFLNKTTLLISASPLLWLRQFPQLRW